MDIIVAIISKRIDTLYIPKSLAIATWSGRSQSDMFSIPNNKSKEAVIQPR